MAVAKFRFIYICIFVFPALGIMPGCSDYDDAMTSAVLEGRFDVVVTETAEGRTVEVLVPEDLIPNTIPATIFMLIVHENREASKIAKISSGEAEDGLRSGSQLNNFKYTRHPNPDGTIPKFFFTHGMLIGFPVEKPTKSELEDMILGSISTPELSDQEVSERLQKKAGEIQERYPGSVVRIERFTDPTAEE